MKGFKDMEKKIMDLDKKYENRSDDDRNGNVIANQGETVMAGLHKETTESEVADTLKEMIREIGMDYEKVKLVYPAKPITHAFVYFENDNERNKFIRSANMLKKELRGRKIRITRSMEAEERFYKKRINRIRQKLHQCKTWHPSTLDLTEPEHKTCINQRTDCGEDMSRWISQVQQVPRRGRRS